jgi:hypothetical protein
MAGAALADRKPCVSVICDQHTEVSTSCLSREVYRWQAVTGITTGKTMQRAVKPHLCAVAKRANTQADEDLRGRRGRHQRPRIEDRLNIHSSKFTTLL